MNALNLLPRHIIADHIAPYLDYESAINLNRVLDPHHRVSRTFPPEFCDIHHCRVCLRQMNAYLAITESLSDGVMQIKVIMRMLTFLTTPCNLIILRCHDHFREIVLNKLSEFERRDKDSDLEREFKRKLHEAIRIIEGIHTVPHTRLHDEFGDASCYFNARMMIS